MITLFETYNNEPKIGDWVVLNLSIDKIHRWKDWFISLIEIKPGLITDINGENYEIFYEGRYNNHIDKFMPNEPVKPGEALCRSTLEKEDIEYFGTKEEMEMILQTKKYNI